MGHLLWGAANEEISRSAFDKKNGTYYFCGATASSASIATTGAYQTTYGGATDAFIAKLTGDTLIAITQPYTDTFLCAGGTWNVAYTVTYNFNSGNKFTVQLSDATGSFASPANIGSVTATGSGTISATIPSGTTIGTGYRIRIVSSNPVTTSADNYYNIHIISSLATPTVTSNTPICIGGTIKLTASTTTPPVTYSWVGPGSTTIAPISNPAISGARSADAGKYTVTTSSPGCPSTSASTNVVVNTTFPDPPADSSNSPVCVGSTLNLYTRDSISAATYTWSGPNGFTSTLQNPTITSASATATGSYFVTATYMGCSVTDSFSVYVNAPGTPTINIAGTPSDTACAGQSISFVSSITYGGGGPVYQWYKNSKAISGANYYVWGSPYLSDADTIYCVLTSDATCITNAIDTSNRIVVNIIPSVTPSVTITASPGTGISAGATVTFSTIVSNAGTSTSYQWYINGYPVSGANSATYITNLLSNGDVVTVAINTNPVCAATDTATSNKLTIRINTTGIAINNINSNFSLYPDPNNGTFMITGAISNPGIKEISLEVLNTIGQVVYSDKAPVTGGTINKQIILSKGLSNGMYLLRVQGKDQNTILRFVKQ